MQNKGLVRTLAVLLAVVAAFYLSFSFVTNYQHKKAVEYAQGNSQKVDYYLDSISNTKLWFGYTYKECREKEINLGLDLKGGMNVTMEVSIPDILNALSDYNTSETFTKALADAKEKQKKSQSDFVTLFIESFREVDPNAKLSACFPSLVKDINSSSTQKLDDNELENKVIDRLREDVEDAIDNSFNVLRTRIDRFGVVQPNIQKLEQTGRILIELPGVKEPERVRKLLQGTANLEFWETYEAAEILPSLRSLNAALANNESMQVENAEAVNEEINDSTEVQEVATEVNNTQNNPLLSILNTTVAAGPRIGTAIYTDTANINRMLTSKVAKTILKNDVKFCWSVKASDDRGTVYELIALKSLRDGRPVLEGDVITDARSEFNQTSPYAYVSMTMNSRGAKDWARITRENIGKSIAIVLDGYVYSYPTVQNEIAGGSSQITGNFTVEEAKDLANTLKSGKMPAPARIIQEDVVGPSLGQKAIHDGMWSFVIGFVLILLYMIFYYGLIPGLIADAALLCNVFLLIGILASFGSVLTLPGIAGIVLTMGMAVDANVLIYERIREEMQAGKNMRKAIADGFSGAISAIIDANVTSLLTGIVLIIFGTGPIKGFAVTFVIGIISSFLTAVFITRLLLEDYSKRETAKELPFTTSYMKNFLKNTHVDFVKFRKIAYIISGVIIVIGLLGLEPHIMGKLNLGIDFSGGRNYIVRFEQPVSTEDVKASLDNVFMATLQDGETYSMNVITIGDANQVRISTNYRIHDNEEGVDEAIEMLLYEGCKPFLSENITTVEFLDTQANAEIGIMQSQKVGPSIADDIKQAAVWSILFALIIIFLYILIRFRNAAYSTGALVALAHDTIIVLGLYALLWKIMPFSMEIDQAFIAAILTIIGYSVNDTVVVFDRIREYNTLYAKRDRAQNINDAINATLSRTFSTSMSTFVVLLAIFIFGGETIRGFVFALLIGVIIGTYSSIFIATPIAYDIQQAVARRKARKAAK